jgi:hypothetical protein
LRVVALAVATCALSACASRGVGSSAANLADSITRAVYANDYDATTANFDAATKAEVTRTEIGELSDKMHALGAYRGLTQTNVEADRGLYDFDLSFAGGHMVAKLRLDPSGKVGAYRVIPSAVPPPQPTTG